MNNSIKEKDLINVIIHLISSSRLIIDEPKEYSTMRLFSAAKYLCRLLKDTDDQNINLIVKKIIELEPIITRDLFNKPKELKLCLDVLSIFITKHIRGFDE